MSLVPALRKQRHMDLCEFKTNLVYRVSSQTARTVTQRNPVSKQTNKQTNKQKSKEKEKEK